jgi:hypothetical protein
MRNHVVGVVNDCLRMAIYKEPRANSKVITVVTALTKVAVDVDKSTEGFYRVSTPKGAQGYCMKKFVAVRQ